MYCKKCSTFRRFRMHFFQAWVDAMRFHVLIICGQACIVAERRKKNETKTNIRDNERSDRNQQLYGRKKNLKKRKENKQQTTATWMISSWKKTVPVDRWSMCVHTRKLLTRFRLACVAKREIQAEKLISALRNVLNCSFVRSFGYSLDNGKTRIWTSRELVYFLGWHWAISISLTSNRIHTLVLF